MDTPPTVAMAKALDADRSHSIAEAYTLVSISRYALSLR